MTLWRLSFFLKKLLFWLPFLFLQIEVCRGQYMHAKSPLFCWLSHMDACKEGLRFFYMKGLKFRLFPTRYPMKPPTIHGTTKRMTNDRSGPR